MMALGACLGKTLFDGAVVGLSGPLGAGKTTMAAGIAKGMGIDEDYVVSSPTYTIMQSYPCSERILHHLDLYRIKSREDLDSTGYREGMGENTVLLVEWPEKEQSVLPHEHLLIEIEYCEQGREVSLFPTGDSYIRLVESLFKDLESGKGHREQLSADS